MSEIAGAMKKIFTVCLALFALFLNSFAQDYSLPKYALPEKGDIRIGIGWGWALNTHFEERDGFGHSKPIIPIQVTADYTLLNFADGKGSVAAGAMFEYCRYQTWFTQTFYGSVKTTQTWTRGILAATASVRYTFWQDLAVFGTLFLGKDLQLGYDEEYSDEGFASIVPHTSGPGSYSASGILAGISNPISEHSIISIYFGYGSYTTLGINWSYKF